MLVLLSPSKTLDFNSELTSAFAISKPTRPVFAKECLDLVRVLAGLSTVDLQALMSLSPKLAQLNFDRYQAFEEHFSKTNSRPALMAFRGDVYRAFEEAPLSSDELDFADKHLLILSGLYGLLRPLDLMQPYRLEMGTELETLAGSNLYDFWSAKITQQLNKLFKQQKSRILVNLASKEYFKVVDQKSLEGSIVHVHFKEQRGAALKIIALNAKRARGIMARWIIEQRIDNPDTLKAFDRAGYAFRSDLSTATELVFAR